MNYLQAVFWDHVEFTDPDTIRRSLETDADGTLRIWLLKRFLEHGRVVDTLRFFDLATISSLLPALNLRDHARRKWTRMLEIYGPTDRG